MKSFGIACIILMGICPAVGSQDIDLKFSGPSHYVSFYPELLGNGGGLSISLEYLYLFSQRTKGTYARVGKGGALGTGNTFGEVGLLLGKNTKYLDLGIGYTVLDNTQASEYMYVIRFGYRKQSETGFLFRIAPLIMIKVEPEESGESKTEDAMLWAGLSLGYSIPLKGKSK